MRQFFDRPDCVFECSKMAENYLKATFTTSADVVMEASGLCLEAIRVNVKGCLPTAGEMKWPVLGLYYFGGQVYGR